MAPRRDRQANSKKMAEPEEIVIVNRILELDSQGFPPRLSHVEDMANNILASRRAGRVGKRWVRNFVNRRPELKTRLNRPYDYQRAKCEDPNAIRAWFQLVANTIAKYGIVASDIYNFDETGFLMGQITPELVVTSSERRGKVKQNQPGNRDWVTVIQAVGALGYVLPPFIIFKGLNHLESWYQDRELPTDWVITTSENGWTTNQIGLDWIKHFDRHTASRAVGKWRLLVLDGHETHHSVDFEDYCKANNIITLCMPPHSSHLLQPLDVGCFRPLKRAYGKEIEDLMRVGFTAISKEDFLPAFAAAFKAVFTESNVQGGFRGAGLYPHDPEKVISQLDIKLKTPTPPNSRPATAETWTSKTPTNPLEVSSQTDLLKFRIQRHQNSSPTQIIEALDVLSKSVVQVMNERTLLRAEVQALRRAQEVLSKRRRAKKRRLQQGGVLSVQEVQDLQDQRDVDRQVEGEIKPEGGRKARVEKGPRRCGVCGETGHNARTCDVIIETSGEEDSE
jgi:hypothetical protein